MAYDIDDLRRSLRAAAPAVDFCGLRVLEEDTLVTTVRKEVALPSQTRRDRGGMVTIVDGDGVGHAAGSDCSAAGLRALVGLAHERARLARGRSVFAGVAPAMPRPHAHYEGPGLAEALPGKAERIDLLQREAHGCRIDRRVVHWEASLWSVDARSVLLSADGAEAVQRMRYLTPSLFVAAHADGRTQTRSFGGRYNGYCQQGGMEVLERSGFIGSGRRTAEGALALLGAPNCPSGTMDLLLMPCQMMLQIHESIGHPLELDRILGDERNFAGTSFVTPEMFGSYRYGSELLDVTYDPGRPEQFASFAVDDEGTRAERTYLIRRGILLRPLGGGLAMQRARAAVPGLASVAAVATARASSWNRPPIDRMSNLNVEPGASSLEDLIGAIDDGVLMQTNASWSIDDSRNKFQFGCEWGRRIRGGRLAEVVRNPNYRGISATFWRSLAMVGNAGTVEVLGTPYCGKGEPSQIVRVGHASPACVFRAVDVFGGAA